MCFLLGVADRRVPPLPLGPFALDWHGRSLGPSIPSEPQGQVCKTGRVDISELSRGSGAGGCARPRWGCCDRRGPQHRDGSYLCVPAGDACHARPRSSCSRMHCCRAPGLEPCGPAGPPAHQGHQGGGGGWDPTLLRGQHGSDLCCSGRGVASTHSSAQSGLQGTRSLCLAPKSGTPR